MNLKFNFEQQTHTGNVRPENEDTIHFESTTNGDLFILCDGMGGALGGKKASSLAVNSIVDYFNKKKYDNVYVALNNSLVFANEQIYATAKIQSQFQGMGTTVCIILIKNKAIYIAHVGDSRIYCFSQKKLYQLTKDHSFVNQLVDQGNITQAEAQNHPQKNRITKALGVQSSIEPTICTKPIFLKKGDMLFQCSDGLTDMVENSKIIAILNSKNNFKVKTTNLLNEALIAGGKDNVSIQLIEITESPHSKSQFEEITKNNKPSTKSFSRNKKIVIGLILLALIITTYFLSSLFLFPDSKNQPDEIKPEPEAIELLQENSENLEENVNKKIIEKSIDSLNTEEPIENQNEE